MKLGVCYMVFDGEELLPFAVQSIRSQVDHLSVTYQTTSYFGNPCTDTLIPTIQSLLKQRLIDEAIFYEPDLSQHHKDNELRLRNIGLEASRKAGCSHHISLDVDEICTSEELLYVKETVANEKYDFTMVPYAVYYKEPTYLITPDMKLKITFIHPVDNEYNYNDNFPFKIEITRRLNQHNSYKIFTPEEITLHHMSYVRKDIRRKFLNSDNGQFYNIDKFIEHHANYKVGDKLCLLPDWLNRRTKEVANQFGISHQS